jgi:hypothetical protein
MLCDLCKDIGNHFDEIFGLGAEGGDLGLNVAKREQSTDEAESSTNEAEFPGEEERSPTTTPSSLPEPESDSHTRKRP